MLSSLVRLGALSRRVLPKHPKLHPAPLSRWASKQHLKTILSRRYISNAYQPKLEDVKQSKGQEPDENTLKMSLAQLQAEASKYDIKDFDLDVLSKEEIATIAEKYNKTHDRPLQPLPQFSKESATVALNQQLTDLAADLPVTLRAMTLAFYDAVQQETIPDCKTMEILLNAYVDCNDFNLAERVLETCDKLHIDKNIINYNAELRWAAKTQEWTRAGHVWRAVIENRVMPTIRTLDYYMRAHGTPDKLAVAIDVFTNFPTKFGLKSDAEMQSAFMKVLLECGKEEIAMKRWEAMVAGKLPSPTNFTIQILLEYFYLKGDYKQVQELFNSIKLRFGLYPDKDNFGVLLRMRIKEGKAEEAFALIKQLCVERWRIHVTVFEELMTYYDTNRDEKQMEALWALLDHAKVVPTPPMLGRLVNAICRTGNPDRAMAYMIKAQDKYKIPFIRPMYCSLMSAYGTKQEMGKVLTLYRRMIFTDNIPPGPTSFAMLVNAYLENGLLEPAIDALRSPQIHGIPKANRHHFEDIIALFERKDDKGLELFYNFDWTKLQGVTSEGLPELQRLNQSFRS